MISADGLAEAAIDARVTNGESLLIHVSAQVLERCADGANTVVAGLRSAVGATGTLLCPAFRYASLRARGVSDETGSSTGKSADWPQQRLTAEYSFADLIGSQEGAVFSSHPVYRFVATGPEAAFLTSAAPFAFPLGSGSPLDHLHQINGRLLLIGCEHDENSLLHLAEIWANAPYVHRGAEVETEAGHWATMEGMPGCTAGFQRIDPILRQARVERSVEIGGVVILSMPVRQVVSMAIAMLQGSQDALLCVRPDCSWCQHARTFTRASTDLGLPNRLSPILSD